MTGAGSAQVTGNLPSRIAAATSRNFLIGMMLGMLDTVRTLPELLAFRLARSPHGEAYRAFDAMTQQWKSTRWEEFGESIATWRNALLALQLPRQARIAILLPNGLNAVCIDQAALVLGLVPVPLHAIDNPGSIAYIVSDCEASMLMVSTLAQWRAIEGVGKEMPVLRLVVVTSDEALPVASMLFPNARRRKRFHHSRHRPARYWR